LQDFSVFLDYLEKNELTLTKKNKHFRGKDLFALNQLMSNSVEDVTKRTRQKSYPELHLFYHLILAGDLYRKKSKTKTKTLLIATEKLEEFYQLTLTEKYFFLLETLWIDADWKELQGGTYGQTDIYTVTSVLEFLSNQKPDREINLKDNHNQSAQMIWNWGYWLFYFELFGFWEVIVDNQIKKDVSAKRVTFAKKVIPTEFGVRMAEMLKEERDLERWNLAYRKKRGELNVIPGSPLSEIEQDPNDISVKEVKIGELGLEEGQEILYLFDYGDEWRFTIRIEEISREESLETAKIVEQQGESPEQYASDFDPGRRGW
jgi:hypothetical protein